MNVDVNVNVNVWYNNYNEREKKSKVNPLPTLSTAPASSQPNHELPPNCDKPTTFLGPPTNYQLSPTTFHTLSIN